MALLREPERASLRSRAASIGGGLATYLDIRTARVLGRCPAQLPILYLEVVQQCNLRCLHCAYASNYPVRGPLLDTAQWQGVLREASQLHTRIVSFSGGEPFLRDDFLQLLAFADDLGLSIHVNSNGTRITDDHARALSRLRNCAIIFSLDHAAPGLNDAVRGKGTYDAVQQAVSRVRRLAPNVHVGLNTVIGPFNLGTLEALVDLGAAWDVHSVKFLPAHDNLNHSWRATPLADRFVFHPRHVTAVRQELEAVKRRATRLGIATNSRRFLRGIERFILGQPTVPCYVGYLIGNIDPYGFLFPCYDIASDAPNVLEGGLAQAWRSPAMARLRAQVGRCEARCWCSGNAEPSLRMQPALFLREPAQFLDDIRMYFLEGH